MALSLLLSVALAQLNLSAPVRTLISPGARWEQRSEAAQRLGEQALAAHEIDALVRALAKLSHAAPKCDGNTGGECSVVIGPCLSPAGFILDAVEGNAAVASFGEAAATLASQPSDPTTTRLAWRVVARAKNPLAEREGQRLLARGTYDCVGEAVALLAPLPTWSDATRAAVAAAVRSSPAGAALSLGTVVALRTEPWASALTLEALGSPDFHLRLGVVRGARGRPPIDEAVRTALTRVARCDPSERVASEASLALKLDGGAGGACPAPAWTAVDDVVRGRGTEVTLARASTVPPPSAACVAWTKKKGADASRGALKALGTVGDACVVALDVGEFGGGLFLWRDGVTSPLVDHDGFLNPIALLTRGDELLVVSALRHMGGSGGLAQLSTDGGKTFHFRQLMQYGGLPVAWAARDGRLFIALEAGDFSAPCRVTDGTPAITVYEPDGTWSLARNAATACRWPER